MLFRMALLVAGLLLAGNAAGTDPPRSPSALICAVQTHWTRLLAVDGAFDGPRAINALIVNVIDGKLPQVRQQLQALPQADAVRWRQSALVIAAYARMPAMVAGLLEDGALVDGQGTLPRLDGKLRDQLIAAAKKDPNWDTADPERETANELDAVLPFDGRPVARWPPSPQNAATWRHSTSRSITTRT